MRAPSSYHGRMLARMRGLRSTEFVVIAATLAAAAAATVLVLTHDVGAGSRQTWSARRPSFSRRWRSRRVGAPSPGAALTGRSPVAAIADRANGPRRTRRVTPRARRSTRRPAATGPAPAARAQAIPPRGPATPRRRSRAEPGAGSSRRGRLGRESSPIREQAWVSAGAAGGNDRRGPGRPPASTGRPRAPAPTGPRYK